MSIRAKWIALMVAVVLMLVGMACGALTGIVADSVMKHLKTIR